MPRHLEVVLSIWALSFVFQSAVTTRRPRVSGSPHQRTLAPIADLFLRGPESEVTLINYQRHPGLQDLNHTPIRRQRSSGHYLMQGRPGHFISLLAVRGSVGRPGGAFGPWRCIMAVAGDGKPMRVYRQVHDRRRPPGRRGRVAVFRRRGVWFRGSLTAQPASKQGRTSIHLRRNRRHSIVALQISFSYVPGPGRARHRYQLSACSPVRRNRTMSILIK